MRDEDYQAMAERARRAEAELARLQSQHSAARARWTGERMRVIARWIGLAAAVVGLLLISRAFYRWATTANPPPCYFVSQFKYDQNGAESGPWSPWFLWRDTHEFGNRNRSIESAGSFQSRNEAWQRLQSLNLPACK